MSKALNDVPQEGTDAGSAASIEALNLTTDTRQANWRRAFPDRYRAHVAVQGAIGRGVLIKGPCEVCGITEADGALIDGHHDDYSKPLDVRWLCRQHHIRLHNGGEDLFGVPDDAE